MLCSQTSKDTPNSITMCLVNTEKVSIPELVGYKEMKICNNQLYARYAEVSLEPNLLINTWYNAEDLTHPYPYEHRVELNYTPGFHCYEHQPIVGDIWEFAPPTYNIVIAKVVLKDVYIKGYEPKHTLCYVGKQQKIIEVFYE